jgi:hypothetical protein
MPLIIVSNLFFVVAAYNFLTLLVTCSCGPFCFISEYVYSAVANFSAVGKEAVGHVGLFVICSAVPIL